MNTPSSIPVFHVLLALIAAVLLTACQHRTPYRASAGDNAPGYTSWQESGAVFHVKYTGSLGAKFPELRDLALLRAAEIARDAGSREFVILAECSDTLNEFVRPDTTPPQSAIAGIGATGERSEVAREVEARSRPMITSSVGGRIDTHSVELKISTQPDVTLRTMDASAPYSVEALLRDIPAKHGLRLAARS